MVMFSGLETAVEPFRAGNQKLQLGGYRAEGIDHRQIKYAGLNIFAEFGHGDSAVLEVSIGAPRSETGVSFGYPRMRPLKEVVAFDASRVARFVRIPKRIFDQFKHAFFFVTCIAQLTDDFPVSPPFWLSTFARAIVLPICPR